MNISYEDIGFVAVTFPADSSCQVGKICTMGSSGTVIGCASGDEITGLVLSKNGSQAGVQIHGFVTVPYSGTAPTTGYQGLSANGSGGVAADTDGTVFLVVAVDTTAKTITFEL